MKDDLHQLDLSHLAVRDMNRDQRLELKRRFETFVAAFVPKTPTLSAANPRVRKWVPGMKS